MTINDYDSLYMEASTGAGSTACLNEAGDDYEYNIDYQMAHGIGFTLGATHFYGMAERESEFIVHDTVDQDPYRFFNIDYYAHQIGDARGEYGSIPYVTAHSLSVDLSVAWMNSADTWSDVLQTSDTERFVSFYSESGQLEFFVFSGSTPKTVLRTLADITGNF